MKIEFLVPDMTCGHCVKTIGNAVRKIAPDAQVLSVVETHCVTVDGIDDPAAIEAAIRAEGYTPARL